ncbi:bifunctional ADP-dependent NAD(P)H-hydrate dehydratase/NAD(P)H-hydrate epimerase [Tolumonas lignilytica]|uniref:bifunctional ADP-dependent NAD(P)H-hydrate dehydratase/NAD(P)H-hydrate epimerase n=1 Tax=Tolumonas lignilytica TaxID=1283284 RepID=UPI0004B46F95|nr:bifunctional ADP-dependent NAD(P)H-hydrate dehydratase/NAD(P)H-hydrate epimerase [Tolumonas lignilytica]
MNHSAPVITNICDSLPHYSWRTEQIRLMEQQLIATQHLSMYQLMQRAGEALLQMVRSGWPAARALWIFCGKGNNGGDGYVLAKLARNAGYQVVVVAFDEPVPGIPAEEARRDWLKSGGHCTELNALTGKPDLIVDALLGIGPSTPLRSELLAWIQFINRQAVPILSVDIPSGLHADTGMPLGGAIHAATTLSFVGLKCGLLTGLAADYIGKLYLADLKNEHTDYCDSGGIQVMNYDYLYHWLPSRARTAHKGDCGKVLLAGGGPGMPGAIRLAGEAALRSGAGLVRVFCHPDNRSLVFNGRPELMLCLALDPQALAWPDVLITGPGLGTDEWGQTVWQSLLSYNGHWVVDADGLNLLALTTQKRQNWILTPHPGEAARLLRCTIDDIQNDRFAAIQELQHRYGGVILLKGPGTLIYDGKQMAICTEGNPGMASGGMGDVLSGIIAALLAQGLSLFQAACCGALLHGKAANEVAKASGERGMLASDLFFWVQRLANPQRYQHGKNADTNTE